MGKGNRLVQPFTLMRIPPGRSSIAKDAPSALGYDHIARRVAVGEMLVEALELLVRRGPVLALGGARRIGDLVHGGQVLRDGDRAKDHAGKIGRGEASRDGHRRGTPTEISVPVLMTLLCASNGTVKTAASRSSLLSISRLVRTW